MPTVERLDHPARLEEIARSIVAGEPVGAYDARDIRRAAAELARLARGRPPGDRDHKLTDPEWRALVKPIVLAMHRQGLTRFVLIKADGDVHLEMT